MYLCHVATLIISRPGPVSDSSSSSVSPFFLTQSERFRTDDQRLFERGLK
jgi:hypothetical protein